MSYALAPKRVECPSGKVRHATERLALNALALAMYRAKYCNEPLREERRAYSCRKCSGWHLTSRADGAPLVRRRRGMSPARPSALIALDPPP